MIEVKKLVFDYPHFRALKDISFTIPEGRITALVGPNGAGKTTLFSCIAGLEEPFSGSVHVNNILVSKHPRETHNIVGFLPDFFGLYENLTVRKSLEYFASLNKIDKGKIDESIVSTAKRLGIYNKIDESVSNLSRGMRQRLAIGQIIIGEPKVLLLDEPASGLDPEARFKLGELFKQLKKEGMTIIVSSHILAELEQYADDLLIIENGELISHSYSEESKESHIQTVSLKPLSEIDKVITYLESIEDVEIKLSDNSGINFTLQGTKKEASDLLRDLINKGFSIYSFNIEDESMQKKYIDSLNNRRVDNV